ncbi:MAG: hypothetical protein OHK0022_08810 [Roseiflexaceae bacterium]
MAAIDRTAYPRYRRAISPRELAAHYTLHADEQQWVRNVARGSSGILTCAWLLKAVQHLGYFPAPSDPVPPTVAAHLRATLELPATATLGTVSPRTLYTYQRQSRDLLGLITDERNARYTARRRAAQALLQAAQVQDNPADLMYLSSE